MPMIDKERLKDAMCVACGNGVIDGYACNGENCTMMNVIDEQPTIEAEPVRHGRWLNTDETVLDAKDIDGKQQLEISIVAARCSACGHWSEQVNQFPPYMHYKFCPHCGAVMDAEHPKRRC